MSLPSVETISSALDYLPWSADPDTWKCGDGITLQCYIASGATGTFEHMESDAFGDFYCEDSADFWHALMDGTLETQGEAVAWILNRLTYRERRQ